ncbi:hypothetical protein [Acidaminobacter sp.]|uniref:hypothetical protein n=1 Tax=Acidaminobacter sp. TaxID=1872102 RepID=UPI00256D7258|nr:hypothetical protein [Acidaminobacter sp.]MDK9712391.1 hypothetical protein [Acidaminobacter sp.]
MSSRGLSFNRQRKESGLRTKWLWFYVFIFLPVYFIINALLTAAQIQMFAESSTGIWARLSNLIWLLYFVAILIVCAWTFAEALSLSRRAHLLIQVSFWSLFGYVLVSALITVAQGRSYDLFIESTLGIIVFMLWCFPNHNYFRRRKEIFGAPPAPEQIRAEVSENLNTRMREPETLPGSPLTGAVASAAEAVLEPSAGSPKSFVLADGHPTPNPSRHNNFPDEHRSGFELELRRLRGAGLITEETLIQVLSAHRQLNVTLTQKAESEKAAREAAAAQNAAQAAQTRRVLSKQELRDRNITLVLVLGVLFVMLAGTIFATSNWSLFSSALKTALILLVAVLFFSVSLLAEKKLHIEKTSFAFWVLGALFVPVIFLSIGYFELFGKWLSLQGDGKYVLGLISMAASALVYGYSTLKFNNRIFAWMTLTAVSLGAGFAIASLRLGVDRFYLGIALINGLFVLAGLGQKVPVVLQSFHKELHRFVPVNLSISSALMLVVFEEPRFQGINLLMASVLFTVMVFTRWEKEYSIPAGLLLMAGLYQFVEHSGLRSLDLILFSVTGFAFLGLSLASGQRDALQRLYRALSAAAALITFIYIQLTSLTLLEARPSWTALAGLVLITLNALVLAVKTGERPYAWAFPVLLTSVAHQGYDLIHLSNAAYLYAGHMGGFGAAMFLLLYAFNPWKAIQRVRGSSGVVAVMVMGLSYLMAVWEGHWLTGILVLGALIGLLTLTYFRQKRQLTPVSASISTPQTANVPRVPQVPHLSQALQISQRTPGSLSPRITTVLSWSLPVLTMIELLTVYRLIDPQLVLSTSKGGYSLELHSALATLVLFLMAVSLKRFERQLTTTFFWIAHVLFPAAILLLLQDYGDFPPVFTAAVLIYLYSFRMFEIKQVEPSALQPQSQTVLSCAFLYSAYISGGLTVMSLFNALKLNPNWNGFVLPVFSLILFIIWHFLKGPIQRWTLWFLIPSAWLGAAMLAARPASELTHFSGVVISLVTALYLMRRSDLEGFSLVALLPLFLSAESLNRGAFYGQHTTMLAFLAVLTALLALAGNRLLKQLYVVAPTAPAPENTSHRSLRGFGTLDGYTLNALLMILLSQTVLTDMSNPGWLRLLPPLELTALLFMQRGRAGSGLGRRIANTLWFISLLLPYWITLDLLQPSKQFLTELRLLPLLPMVTVLTPWQWKAYDRILRWIEAAVLVLIALTLFVEILSYDLLTDALILGVLSLVALFYGMQGHRRDYFFTGAAALLANAIFQTRGFWQSLPWWAYLLMAGLTLIGIASYNELKARR